MPRYGITPPGSLPSQNKSTSKTPVFIASRRLHPLRGLSRPQYRLRVGDDVRVFYDVTEDTVEVLAIVPKSEANEWLERYGETDEESGSD